MTLGYLGYVRVSDGVHSVSVNQISEVIIKTKSGYTTKLKIGKVPTKRFGYDNKISVLLGYSKKKGRSLVEELEYSKRYYRKNEVEIPYRRNTWTGVSGWIWRRDTIGKDKGICHTLYKNGSFREQYFVYSNGQKAYHFKRGDNTMRIKYPNGRPRLEFIGETSVYTNFYGLRQGYPCVEPQEYSGSRNYELLEYYRNGRIKTKVSVRNGQVQGECIRNGVAVYYINGLVVPKKLYDAKPEDINPAEVLRIANAQVRAMMLKKIGLARVVACCKGKIIDQDDKGSILYDFPVAYDKSKQNDAMERFERVLKVVCPSTKQDYFLRIPCDENFNTCEKARQGTFTGFNPEAKPIEFAMET